MESALSPFCAEPTQEESMVNGLSSSLPLRCTVSSSTTVPCLEAQAQPKLRSKRDADCGSRAEEIAQRARRHAKLAKGGDRLRSCASRVEAKSRGIRSIIH